MTSKPSEAAVPKKLPNTISELIAEIERRQQSVISTLWVIKRLRALEAAAVGEKRRLADLRTKVEDLKTEQRQFVGWKSRHKVDAFDAVLKLIDESEGQA